MTDERMTKILAQLHEVYDELVRYQVTDRREPEPDDNPGGSLLGSPGRRGARRALHTMLRVAEGWADTAAENDESMGKRKPAEQKPFFLDDIKKMVQDALSELGL